MSSKARFLPPLLDFPVSTRCAFSGTQSPGRGPAPALAGVLSAAPPGFLTLTQQTTEATPPPPGLRPHPFPPRPGRLGVPPSASICQQEAIEGTLPRACWNHAFQVQKQGSLPNRDTRLPKDFRTKGVKLDRAAKEGCQAHSSRDGLPSGECLPPVPSALVTDSWL